MTKVIVLGSNGFIGTHIVDHFNERGYAVTGCDLSVSGYSENRYIRINPSPGVWDDLFKSNQFDFCINAAGSGNVSFSIAHPLDDFNANTAETVRLLDAIRKFNPACKYVHISSAAVYGNPKALPVTETDSCKPISPYGYHKWMSELICTEYHALFGMQTAILRPFSVYGERQRKQLLWDTCQKLALSDQVTLFGTGDESRDFIYVKDLARLIECIIRDGRFDATVYNAAAGNETTIREVARLITNCYNGAKRIVFSGEVRHGDPLNWRADISASTAIGFTPVVSLEEGISRYKKWFDEQGR